MAAKELCQISETQNVCLKSNESEESLPYDIL